MNCAIDWEVIMCLGWKPNQQGYGIMSVGKDDRRVQLQKIPALGVKKRKWDKEVRENTLRLGIEGWF